MKKFQKITALIMSLVLTLSLSASALAAISDTGFSDVDADAWYADEVIYCRDQGLMQGTSETEFSPADTMSRAMLVTVLHRIAGSPVPANTADFTDVDGEAWYAAAVSWASETGVANGYGNGLFGPDDSISREQLATALWRYLGSPAATQEHSFSDSAAISSYAVPAVAWAYESGIVTGRDNNVFDPAGSAARAEAAAMLYRYSSANSEDPEPEPAEGNILVAYFSATGTTEGVAVSASEILSADTYEIVPAIPYTTADLNYNDSGSRSTLEQNDASARPAISGSVSNMDEYDVVLIAYPIWRGQAPRIVSTFLESYDFSGMTIVPLCTSGSSGIGSSTTALQSLTPNANWQSGRRFPAEAASDEISAWLDTLELTPANTQE